MVETLDMKRLQREIDQLDELLQLCKEFVAEHMDYYGMTEQEAIAELRKMLDPIFLSEQPKGQLLTFKK